MANSLVPAYRAGAINHALGARALRNSGRISLSACAMKYAAACNAPFSEAARGSCVPIGGQPSYRITAFVRGDGAIGTAGVGYVAMTPTLASDMPFVFATNSLYTQSGLSVVSALNNLRTGVDAVVHNGPYAGSKYYPGANLKPSVFGRVVGCGLTLNYSGTTLSQSGMASCYRSASHSSAVTSSSADVASIAFLGARPDTIVCPFTRDPCMVTDFAASEDELGYPSGEEIGDAALTLYPFCKGVTEFPTALGNTSTYSVGGLPVSPPTCVIAVTGVAGQTFHYEAIIHLEVTGELAAAQLTPSHVDPVGTEMVRTASAQVAEQRALPSRDGGGDKSVWETFTGLLSGAFKRLAPIAVPILEKGLISLVL